MFGLKINPDPNDSLRVLCLGAHCDDIEIGCGGTVLKLAGVSRSLEVRWVVFSSDECRKREALRSAEAFLSGIPNRDIVIYTLRDGYFPHVGTELKELFEQVKSASSPDIIFTHYRNDLHQDHRMVSELTWNTFRNHLILEYEVPKYDGDFGSPNTFVNLEQTVASRKIDIILDTFQSQTKKHWFSHELFSAVLRLRGMEANSPSGYAEGFYCRKVNLTLEV